MSYVTKGGVIQKVHEDTVPLWLSAGWSLDNNRDGVPDNLGGVASAALASDIVLTAGVLTDVVSLSLPVGTWVVSATTSYMCGATVANADLILGLGTAVATIAGLAGTSARLQVSAPGSISLDGLLVVTTAGTIVMRTQVNQVATVKAATTLLGLSPATGLVALRAL